MNFASMVDHGKQAREYVQQSPVPYLPPALLCSRAGVNCASVLSPRSDEQSLAGMLGMIPAAKADEAMLTLEGYVRPMESQATGPIAEDPFATPALLMLYATRAGEIETSINPYVIGDDGILKWSSPGPVNSPAVPKLCEALTTLLRTELEGEFVVEELCDWLLANGYSIKVHPSVLHPEA